MEQNVERLIRYLQDAHAAEVGIKKMLEGFIDDADEPEMQAAFREHIQMTDTQAARIEQRLRDLGEEPSGGKGFFNGLMAKVSELMHGAHDDYDKATQNLIKAYATEHLEVGMYESLAAYSEAIGDQTTAELAREIQQQEEQTAQRLFPMIQRCAVVPAGLAGSRTL